MDEVPASSIWVHVTGHIPRGPSGPSGIARPVREYTGGRIKSRSPGI